MNTYTEAQIKIMRETLCSAEFEQLSEKDIYFILMEGCTGWGNMSDNEVISDFEETYPTLEERDSILG